ncbi:MAG: C4-dicarboxylate ABC transporter substrate-binding protein, partial [Maioricimonas sp. JB049]
IALKLLESNGLKPDHAEAEDDTGARYEAVPLGGRAAAGQLVDGAIDAAFFVLSPKSNLIRELLRNDSIRLVRLKRHDAYQQLFPFLSSVTLAEGVVDLQQNLPPEPIPQIAPAANLICTPELHDAFVPLLLRAAKRVHGSGDLYVEPSRFPSLEFAEFRPHPVAVEYYEAGPSLLQRHLPFWVASLIDRTKIMLLPLITLAFPLFKLAPPVYRWRIRSRIYRWYKVLREIDQHVDRSTARQREQSLKTLTEMQQELEEIKVPLSYMEEFYNLRLHIDLVRRRLESAGEHSATAQAAPREGGDG